MAKIAGIERCQAYNRQYGTCFTSAMPTNLYGPRDNFNLLDSHVIPVLIRRFQAARASGAPPAGLFYVDDLADACLFLMQHYRESEIINVGVGQDLTIRELAAMVARVTGYKGGLRFDPSQPDGTPRKLLDVSRLAALAIADLFFLAASTAHLCMVGGDARPAQAKACGYQFNPVAPALIVKYCQISYF